ncbi:hypothetical protein DPSP01_014394 [Paraphaeosphaeria sporulosa]
MRYAWNLEWLASSAKALRQVNISNGTRIPRCPRGDIASRRAGVPLFGALQRLYPGVDERIRKTDHIITAPDGHEVLIYAFEREKDDCDELRPAVLYIHGGGMMMSSAEDWARTVQFDVARTGVPHFSVDYRIAPEDPHPTPVEDCYAALIWMHSRANDFGIDKSRIAVAGFSSGGGLAAAVAILARDRGLQPKLARQVLLEPMLDDRNTVEDADLAPFVTWNWDDNWTGWNALLGASAGGDEVEPSAVPARLDDFKGLPATYIDCGNLDIFAEESEVYAKKLKEAGVAVEWHLYEGVPHGFELRGAGSAIFGKALENRWAALRSL